MNLLIELMFKCVSYEAFCTTLVNMISCIASVVCAVIKVKVDSFVVSIIQFEVVGVLRPQERIAF